MFDRRGHRAQLTPAGRELLDAGRLLLRAAGELEHRVRRVATGWETELAIAVDAIVPFERLWPLVAAFYVHCRDNAAANTRLRLSREVLGGAWDALADRRADLVIGASGDPPPGGGYRIAAAGRGGRRSSRSRRRIRSQTPRSRFPRPSCRATARSSPATRRARCRRGRSDCWKGRTRWRCPISRPSSPRRSRGWAAASCRTTSHCADLVAGRLVVKTVETPRAPLRMQAAWREPKPGRALGWWIDAVSRADWAFVAPAPAAVAPARTARKPPGAAALPGRRPPRRDAAAR